MDTIVMPITGKKVKIALGDFPKIMCWEDANNACKALGKGWRLPTKDELKEIYNFKDEIGGFLQPDGKTLYWSSDKEVVNYEDFYFTSDFSSYKKGKIESYPKDCRLVVRAVKTSR